MAGMIEYLQALPKAELHLHLEGSILPSTLQELAPSLESGEVLSRYQYNNFAGFLQSYGWVTSFLKEPAHYALVTRRLLEQLASQNVRYVELNLSIGVMLWRQQDAAAMFDAIQTASAQSEVTVRFIFDAVRQFGVEAAQQVAELAAERMDRGVVAFGIGGDEARGPAAMFRDVFIYAERQGLKLVPHAGESAGPESIWQSIELGAARIGHGFRAVEDPLLVRYLRDYDIPLEICVSSNVCTQVVRSLREHPLRRLYDSGVPVTLNTDDPAMFHTTLVREYEIASREFGFGRSHIEEIAGNAFRYAFTAAPAAR